MCNFQSCTGKQRDPLANLCSNNHSPGQQHTITWSINAHIIINGRTDTPNSKNHFSQDNRWRKNQENRKQIMRKKKVNMMRSRTLSLKSQYVLYISDPYGTWTCAFDKAIIKFWKTNTFSFISSFKPTMLIFTGLATVHLRVTKVWTNKSFQPWSSAWISLPFISISSVWLESTRQCFPTSLLDIIHRGKMGVNHVQQAYYALDCV